MDESRIKMVNVFDRHSTLGFKVSNSKYQVKLIINTKHETFVLFYQ